ncbi:hypothetical protein M9458_006843, partial [Cirrhinus mrigala]
GPDHHGPGPLRAAPTGEEQGASHSTVSEINLPTLPVFQGVVVSSEPTPQTLPPGNVAELGSSPPLRWSLEQLVRSLPVGLPLQDTELAAQTNSEASLERLVPLVDYLAAWKLLPNVSAWVLCTVERGYRIQFGAPPPPFNGVFLTLVGPKQGLVMEQEVDTLLRKEAIEVVPPHDRDINDWLILAQSEQMVVQHRDVVLAHMKELGLRLNAKKSVLSPLQRTTYLGMVWDSTTMQARLSPAQIKSILTAVARVKEDRSLTVKKFQQLLGLMAAASSVIPFGLLYMRPLQWWLRTKGFSPRGNPFRMIKVTQRCLRALDMWKKPWFLSLSPRNTTSRTQLTT